MTLFGQWGLVREFVLIFGAAACFTTGGIFMKMSDGLQDAMHTSLMLMLFMVGACLQGLVMRGADMGVTYVVVLGVEAILAMLFGAIFFDEGADLLKCAGVVMIVAGISALRI